MVIDDKYFYQTVLKVAAAKNYTMVRLATICGVKTETLKRQLQRKGQAGISMATADLLRQELAPNLTLDELFPEAGIEANRLILLTSQRREASGEHD